MDYPILSRGDRGAEVKRLQSMLNRVGAMLALDGDFGPATETGVYHAEEIATLPLTGKSSIPLWEWLEAQPEPFAKLDTEGVAFIALHETGGLKYYQHITRWPHFPGHESGITIGVGYDLRFAEEHSFIATWSHHLPGPTIEELRQDLGKKGSKKRAQQLRESGIEVPFRSAWPVLVAQTLPTYYKLTLSIYPSLELLHPLCRSALVSLVFNRGARLSGSRRKEMREIQRILELAHGGGLPQEEKFTYLVTIEEQFLLMKRLWAKGSGLIRRRQDEANLWRKGLWQWQQG